MSKTKTIRLPIVTVTRDKQGRRVRNRPGTPITLAADEADTLVKRWGEVKGPAIAAAKPAKPEGEALMGAIAEVIKDLDQDSEEHFTKSGAPIVSAIEKVLGYDITAAERDAAWAAIKKDGGLGL